jgi:hypothetical protein
MVAYEALYYTFPIHGNPFTGMEVVLGHHRVAAALGQRHRRRGPARFRGSVLVRRIALPVFIHGGYGWVV